MALLAICAAKQCDGLFLVRFHSEKNEEEQSESPRGPPGWPIVGILLQLGEKPNESMWALSQKYGPLMTLSLGTKTAVVVSSSDLHKEKDFLDILFDSTPHDLTLKNIRAIILELLTAGSDTTTTTIEWAMVELIVNLHVMKQAQEELEEIIGLNRKVEETYIDCLPYLHVVVKEVFRLHPALPLAIPHRENNSREVARYMISKHTMVIVNVWAIGRDPKIWKELLKFMPKRFINGENSKMTYKGQDFGLIPFGVGRRICSGLPLAHQMIHFTIASLIHSFNWTLPIGMNYEKIDMSDTLE